MSADNEAHEFRRRASALMGLIVGGAVLAATTADLALGFVVLSVLGTLAIYWVAELYVHAMTARALVRHRLEPAELRAIAADGLPMLTVSAIPLAVLVVADLLYFTTDHAASIALGANTLLLLAGGYRIGREAGLRGLRLTLSVALSGALGLVIVALKLVLAH